MFPREQPIDQHDLIAAAESNLFEEFDSALDDANHTETRRDFDFTEVPLPGQPSHGGVSHVIARPKPGVNQKVWGREGRQGDWFEDITVDSRGEMLDPSGSKVGQPQATPAGSPGHCPQCGAGTMLPGGTTAAFCPSCGAAQAPMQQAQVAVQVGGGLQPALVPLPPPPPGPPPGYNSMRMTGKAQAPVEIPPGMGKVTGDDDFMAFLDKAVEAGKEEDKTEAGPQVSADDVVLEGE